MLFGGAGLAPALAGYKVPHCLRRVKLNNVTTRREMDDSAAKATPRHVIEISHKHEMHSMYKYLQHLAHLWQAPDTFLC